MNPIPPCNNRLSPGRVRRSGIALIVTLAMLVLLTFLVVAFFSRATANRQIESTEAGNQKADLLARSALQAITQDLRQEMMASSTISTVSGVSILQPTTNTVAVPVRVLCSGISSADPNFSNLVKQSGTAPLFPSSAPYNNNGITSLIVSSSASTSGTSANGRTVGTARWSTPMLTGTGFSGANQLPSWVLVTRSGIPASQIWTTQFCDSGVANQNFVIGRFAFNIYDEGGLLDINAGGYPSTINTSQVASLKSTLLGAALSQIPGVLNSDALIQWRNRASAVSGTTFMTAAPQEAALGFLKPLSGDNQYISRQDLIRYAMANPTVLSTSGPNALQYLATFTRELNAPSWGPNKNASDVGSTWTNIDLYAPTTNPQNTTDDCTYVQSSASPAYRDNATSPSAINRLFPSVRVLTSGTRTGYNADGSTYNYTVAAGDPLVHTRFDLNKLNWLGLSGPQNGGTPAGIGACFGLQWQPPAGGNVGYWRYVGSNASSYSSALPVQQNLLTLDQVAAQNREPNFFELLKATILCGSLAQFQANATVNNGWPAPYWGYYWEADNHIVQIGANMIDQFKLDSYPTLISFNPGSYPQIWNPGSFDPKAFPNFNNGGYPQFIAGSEDIPMISKITYSLYSNPPYDSSYLYFPLTGWSEFEVWNPYQGASSSGTGGLKPTTFRIHQWYGGGAVGPDNCNESAPLTSPGTGPGHMLTINMGSLTVQNPTTLYSLKSNGATITSSGTNQTYTIGGQTMTVAQADLGHFIYLDPNGSGTTAASIDLPVVGFWLGANVWTKSDLPGPVQGFYAGEDGQTFTVDLQYPSGGWAPVQLLPHASHSYTDSYTNGDSNPIFSSTTQLAQGAKTLLDPRTTRFGTPYWSSHFGTVAASPSSQTTPTAFCNKSVFNSSTDQSSQFRLGRIGNAIGTGYFSPLYPSWDNGFYAVNEFRVLDNTSTTGDATGPYYLDPDGVKRPGDAYWGSGSSPASDASLPTVSGATDDRPIMLHRPYRSVGELGYVYRDLPFKSIDFNSSGSADAGLLDVFTANTVSGSNGTLVAGKVNLNTRNTQVIQAILLGAAHAEQRAPTDPAYVLTSGSAAAIAQALTAFTANNPLLNKASFVTDFGSNAIFADRRKTWKEAAVRAISESTQTRTWNLLVDVVAQAGRFTPYATGLDQFLVEGEKHIWLHVAIDRWTGKVLDSQIETVIE